MDFHLAFCADSLALLGSVLVLALTVLAMYFATEYMLLDPFVTRLLYLLSLFATSVIFLFFCYDYFLVMLSWECIGLFSLLLVNFYSTRVYTVKAALKTFIFSRISDSFMFLSFVLAVIVFNSTDLSLIFLQAPFLAFHYIFIAGCAVHFLTCFAVCLAASGVAKAAQFFFHVWLPDAMEAPTPASALIHSSTLVVAGIFLIVRYSVVFEFAALANYFLALLGAVTLAFGAVTAIHQTDIKKLVAFSTISQIGYLVCGCGFCCYEEVLLYLIVHALNKAFLFILVGYIVHFFGGNTDMRQMGGLSSYSLDVAVLLLGACLNLAGMPYSVGYIGKEFVLFQVLRDDYLSLVVRSCWFASLFFTPVYMLTLVFAVVFGPKKGGVSVYKYLWNRPSTATSDLRLAADLSASRFQLVAVTSRATAAVMLSFWSFFSLFGEALLLVLSDFSTFSGMAPASSFFSSQTHVALLAESSSSAVAAAVSFYVLLLAACAIGFLLNLRYSFK